MDGSLAGAKAEQVLERAGWARSVGGVGPYLTLHARAGITRQACDAAVAKLEIHELPSARGCTYVLPAVDYALGLKLGQNFWDGGDMRTARKLGVTDKEIERLRQKVLDALGKSPLDPEGLKQAVGSASRNLGEEGKKKGITTTLPLALGFLQSTGDIRRIPINGRLDQQRYKYTVWKSNPLAKSKLSEEVAHTELARRFFRWVGPATQAEFQWFSALSGKAAKSAMEQLGLVPMLEGSDRLMFAEDRDSLLSYVPPKGPHYSLVSGLDSLFLARRDVNSFVDAADAKRQIMCEKSSCELSGLKDLPSHAILDRGRIVGLWEYDPGTESIAWCAFVKKDKALTDAVSRTETYVREQLGDARSFSLDSPKSRAPKIAALRG